MRWKKIARDAGLILVAAGLLGTAANLLRSEAYKLAWVQTNPPNQKEAEHPAPEVEQGSSPQAADTGALFSEINAEAAYRMYHAGALFIDARRTAAYEAGHIAGAWSIPVWESDADARVDALHNKGVPYEKDIVVYCSGVNCEDSALLAEKLAFAGFYKLSIYKGGFPDWERRGWPVNRGEQP
jgi:rhodanese-related sulfurtransferase